MNNIIHSLAELNRKNFFNIKKTIVKVVKATRAVDVNKNCIRENLSPIYIYIYIYIYISVATSRRLDSESRLISSRLNDLSQLE